MKTTIAVALFFPTLLHAQPDSAAWNAVGRTLQSPPATAAGYVRYNFPRQDIVLKIGDVTVAPGLALGSWAGFAGSPQSSTVMGDLVLLGTEVPAVLRELDRAGLEVTAIHNHLAGESPTLTYVHFHGEGAAAGLAAKIDQVLRQTGTPRPVTTPAAAQATIDTTAVFSALGIQGRSGGAIVQLSPVLVPGTVRMGSHTLVPAQAYPSPVNIQQVTPDRVVTTGDFAVLEGRVQPLIHALASHGITPTAVHSHLIGETPRIYYIHFWGDGKPADILAGLKAALGQ